MWQCLLGRLSKRTSNSKTQQTGDLSRDTMASMATLRDRQTACVVGLLVGDAAGAVLEFWSHHITSADVDWALSMPGGGAWQVSPGQITDDGELALCLLQALRKFDPSDFNPSAVQEETAQWYKKWYLSPPFDIGVTTRQALSTTAAPGQPLAPAMMQAASGTSSQANGALMRLAPVPAWLAAVDRPDMVVLVARNDALLTHPNPGTQECNAVYALAMWHLLRNPGDADGAVQRATDWAEMYGGADVKEWLKISAQSQEVESMVVSSDNIGWVKWAFILTFYHLRRRTSFADALRSVLLKGGDTDTNAAIVCAMLGALHGSVPEELSRPVLTCELEGAGCVRLRDHFLRPCSVLGERQGAAF